VKEKNELRPIYWAKMKSLGLDKNPRYVERLGVEFKELNNQDEWAYFKQLVDEGKKFPENENNLLIAYLLGLCDDFDIEKPIDWIEGEWPDIDVDYVPPVQDYLRNEWAPKEYGRENVCNIGNYGTFGIRMAMIDMARVFGADRDEILALTTKLGLKDDEGKALSFEKAVELHPEFQDYCERYPQVAAAAQRLIGRIRSRGKHAGGTIIANGPIAHVVPLTLDTDGKPVSAWTEGLHDQDLQPVGYIKFDVLAIKDLWRIADCGNLVKMRYNLEHISNAKDQSDYTDIAYLNDKAALALANEGKTRGIFQFDGDGMRNLLKQGGVTDFEDLVAYSALFRPGPLGMKMHEVYIDRKNGREPGWELEIPDSIKPFLMKTYGVMAYQEQVMQILHAVGDIPLTHCEKVRKAISKKKVAQFSKYKEMFVANGQKNLGWGKEAVENLWEQIESFAEYGFNRSHAVAYTYISSRLLYLKAHYPLEFYTITLRFEPKAEKLCNYKREAEKQGIEVLPPTLNSSEETYTIVDGKIYTGYSNIKGVGEEVAKRIVENQSYNGIEDFLTRFGTDAKVLKPMIQLGMFEGDRATLWAFYEEFKEVVKKRRDREKRHFKTRAKYMQQLRDWSADPNLCEKVVSHEAIMKDDLVIANAFTEGVFGDGGPVEFEDILNVVKKYRRSVLQFEKKEKESDENQVTLATFVPEELEEMPKIRDAQEAFYGFTWKSTIEESPDYDDNDIENEWTFDRLDNWHKEGRMVQVVAIKPLMKKISRKEKPYYQLRVEDVDRRKETITFWEDDYQRFKEELEFWDEDANRGNLFRMQVVRPSNGFSSYKFYAPPRHMRKTRVAHRKEDDARLLLMEPPTDEEAVLDDMRQL
jgi:DNA polymerase III alpha subunit